MWENSGKTMEQNYNENQNLYYEEHEERNRMSPEIYIRSG
jgi:hypothetical protein